MFDDSMQCPSSWLLVVEKETVFDCLARAAFPLIHQCILVTDKGQSADVALQRWQ